MEPENDGAPLESRPATPDDLVRLCRLLNEQGARYLVIGGMAMIHHGLLRLTSDIDLLSRWPCRGDGEEQPVDE